MIVVKVELWRRGDEADKVQLAEARICNVDSDDMPLHEGNYSVELIEPYSGKVRATGEVKKYPRLRLHVWHLVLRALEATIGGVKDVRD